MNELLLYLGGQADPALMYDAVYALARGLHLLQQNSPFLARFPNNASCDSEIAWTDGTSLFNYIDSVRLTTHSFKH